MDEDSSPGRDEDWSKTTAGGEESEHVEEDSDYWTRVRESKLTPKPMEPELEERMMWLAHPIAPAWASCARQPWWWIFLEVDAVLAPASLYPWSLWYPWYPCCPFPSWVWNRVRRPSCDATVWHRRLVGHWTRRLWCQLQRMARPPWAIPWPADPWTWLGSVANYRIQAIWMDLDGLGCRGRQRGRGGPRGVGITRESGQEIGIRNR